MRDYLFHGKRLDNGEWVEGALVVSDDRINPGKCYILPTVSDLGISHGDGGNRVRIGCFVEVDPVTVGQYTGLPDKNGTKIFEGAICRFREWNKGPMCWMGWVHWKHQQFVISGGPNEECNGPFELQMSRFIPDNIEVIGYICDVMQNSGHIVEET